MLSSCCGAACTLQMQHAPSTYKHMQANSLSYATRCTLFSEVS